MADKIQAFDALFTNNHIQIYKLLLPYFEPKLQKKLAVYIKYMEFTYTLNYFKLHPYAYSPKEEVPKTDDLCNEIIPYCTGEEKKKVKQIQNMISNIENMQNMAETINQLKELFPDGFSFDSNQDIMSMFSSMEGFHDG